MKKLICSVAIVAFVVILACGITFFVKLLNDVAVLSSNNETLTNNESSVVERKGYIDNPLPCEIRETYECKIGFVIPEWVPHLGGLECVYEYVDEVLFPGTQNLCLYTGNDNLSCFYFQCKKNGT